MNSLRLLLLLLLLTISACNSTRASVDEQQPQATARSPLANKNKSNQIVKAQGQPSNLVQTTALSPTPIRINPADLPPPFASNSASKPPNVVPIPPNPTLSLPEGFTVNVYAEGLNAPRWLALTPSGDVLVTETRQNRIRLMSDTNGDGVADVNQIFAGSKNGVNIPLGMAFAGDSFFLGNTNALLRFPYTRNNLGCLVASSL